MKHTTHLVSFTWLKEYVSTIFGKSLEESEKILARWKSDVIISVEKETLKDDDFALISFMASRDTEELVIIPA